MKQILLLITVMIFGFSTALAQDGGTPTPDRGEIVSIGAVIAFPATISFRVRVDLPHEEVNHVTLFINQENGFSRTIQLDLENTIFIDFGDNIEYEYHLSFTENPTLKLFQPLTYRFEVETANAILSQATDEIFVEHRVEHAGEWEVVSNDHLTIYWLSARISGERQLDELNEVYALLQQHTDFASPVSFAVYDSSIELCETILDDETGEPRTIVRSDGRPFPCNPDDIPALYSNSDILSITPPDTAYNTVAESLTVALVNRVYAQPWTNADIPAWFRLGLPLFYNRIAQTGSLGLVERAAQENRLLRLNEMAIPPDETSAELWKAQAYVLTLYLAERYGASAPFDLATAISPDLSFSDALAELTSDSLETIYRAWAAWVISPRAEAVAQWNPYLPNTPTPSPTQPSSTPRPTRTPPPTPTITPTRTPAPLFVPTVVVLTQPRIVTLPPAATNTPLPPGFFNNPTPASQASDNDKDGGICGSGIGAMLVPLFGLVLAFRRRKHDKSL